MQDAKEVVFDRTFNAPLEKVWEAFTNPETLKQWWGPDNVSIPECEVDLRVGGNLYIVMEAGEAMGPYKGTRWPMKGRFTEVVPTSKLSYTTKAWTEGQEEATEIEHLSELTLQEENGKTNMHLKVTVTKTGPGAGAALQGMQYGYNQQFDKLERFFANK